MAELPASLARAFAAAALAPALRSLLVLDAPPELLYPLGEALAATLQAATGRPSALLNLAAATGEDSLWGGMALDPQAPGVPVRWRPGLLTRELEAPEHLPVVLIPDLAHIGLLTQRACISLMDAPTAHLERHGRQNRWEPQITWLAACSSAAIGSVSPHLLDRFALRLDGSALQPADRAAELRAGLTDTPRSFSFPAAISTQLQAAAIRPPPYAAADISAAAIELAASAQSVRRPLTLARLAVALAHLAGAPSVSRLHVLDAARLGRLDDAHRRDTPTAAVSASVPAAAPIASPDASASGSPAQTLLASATPAPPDAEAPSFSASGSTTPADTPIFGGESATLAAITAKLYPEDQPRRQAAEPLRLPARRFAASASASGPIIGTEPADTVNDLAIVATLIAAAPWQPLRRQARPDLAERALLLHPGDLRRNRRAPVIEQLLVLVLDYTCRADSNWVAALFPHILWAYQQRAAVTLVQVGAATASNELQAHALSVPNVLVPQLNAAINAEAGAATPLAHGLDLALQTLRRAVQGGRSAVRRARLVVLSDGRGNLPLEASRAGAVNGAVGRRGIDDALHVAQALAGLNHVERLLIAPELQLYPATARDLAAALAAPLLVMAPRVAAPVAVENAL